MMRPAFLDALRSTGLQAFLILVSSSWLTAQDAPAAINIKVKADREEGAWQPVWNYFGYDEPNYMYSPNGKKLLGELAALSPAPVYVRTHNLFTSGDGSASLKLGSTNVYSEDAAGKLAYDWTIVDSIFDTYHELYMKPLVELGFMPQALSVKPEPYRHNFPEGSIYTGWAYPPKDYQKSANLVFHLSDAAVKDTGKARPEVGCGKSGTNRKLAIGRERAKNSSSCMTMPSTQF